MKFLVTIAALSLALVSCSSSGPTAEKKEVTISPPASAMEKASAPAVTKTGAPVKPIKCSYDTDCMIQNSCANEKCKLTGTECRFRSDCPSPRGTCINKVCEFR